MIYEVSLLAPNSHFGKACHTFGKASYTSLIIVLYVFWFIVSIVLQPFYHNLHTRKLHCSPIQALGAK